ncbi:MAG: molybdopterin-guanine dinucleotide biosynthesis protein B [Alphaproteobacteria bacterium]
MKILGLAGWSGSGKTTLVRKLIPELIRRGVTVSTIKHAHHAFDVDRPGKDSYEHRAAGASQVLVSSANRWALMTELRGAPEPGLRDLIVEMAPVDLLLVEGFKKDTHAKLEIYRPSVGKPMLCPDDPAIIGIASDADLPSVSVPVVDLNDIAAVADFVLAHAESGFGATE